MTIIKGTKNANVLNGSSSDDKILGLQANDTVHGGAGNDRLNGNGGNDTLFGDRGHDQLHGGAQNDILIGGLGADTLIGGSGSDLFKYFTYNDSDFATGIDTIKDFRAAVDTIDLSTFGGVTLVSAYEANSATKQATLSYGNGTTTLSIYDGSSTPVFSLHIDGKVSTLEGIVGINENNQNGQPLLVTFEDLDPATWHDGNPIPDGYMGFDWDVPSDENLHVLYENFLIGTGYQFGSIDPGDTVAYTPSALEPVTITASDGSDFIFDQVYLTSAWDEQQNVTVTGYNDGLVVGTFSGTINNDGPTLVDVDWEAIDTLVISDDGLNLVLDNFLFYV